MSSALAIALTVAALVVGVAVLMLIRTRHRVTTPTERAVHSTLHTASLAAVSLRVGLTEESARDALGHLRVLTAADAVALYDDTGRRLAHDPVGEEIWDADLLRHADEAAAASLTDQRRVLEGDPCGLETPVRALVAQPLLLGTDDDATIGGVLMVATTRRPGPGTLGAIAEVARYVSSQLELADLDASRARLDRAEVLALRAQISPHFIYNALNTIASFVRTDPARARELILDFADFTRYSFRAAGEYTVLADELRNVDRYLTLERARFGPKLTVKVQAAPEVLNVVLPFLALQPLVENAVRHGVAANGGGTITVIARDEGTDCVITVEDDGVGMDPELLRSGDIDALDGRADLRADNVVSPGFEARRPGAPHTSTGEEVPESQGTHGGGSTARRTGAPRTSTGERGEGARGGGRESQGAHVGLTNVDHRLRAAFGNDYGLVVDTGIGAGTKVGMRVPKFRAGIRA